jgi:hypothetical protein
MGDTGALRAVKAAGTFILVGLSFCIVGLFVSSIVPSLAILLLLFGIPIAILGLPIGAIVWLASRREAAD